MTLFHLAVIPLTLCGAILILGAILDAAHAWHHAALVKRHRRSRRPAVP